jgi:hypothetical protein
MPQSSSRSLNKASKTTPLPRWSVLNDLYSMGVIVRAGQLVVVFGQPGSGKSTFITKYIVEMDTSALYYSADMDAQDAISREGAMRTGWKVDEVSDAIANGGIDYIAGELSESRIQWVFDPGPTLDDIVLELDAFVELHDAYPRCIVIDNAMNVEGEMEDEQGGLKLVFKELHRLAHETGITVLLLHHAREEGDPKLPPGRDKLQGKVAQLPEIILGVALDPDTNIFRIAPVKVRSGKSDPTGNTYIQLQADPARANFSTYVAPIGSVTYQGQTW